MDGRRWWKMALQTARESLIGREAGVSCFVRLVSKVLNVFQNLFNSTLFIIKILKKKSSTQSSLGCTEQHCIEETEECNDSQANKVIRIKIMVLS